MNQKYLIHEKLYKEYLEKGSIGWGNSQRFDAWNSKIDDLITKEYFPKKGQILELGCGAGNVALMFSKLGYQLSGIDISETAIEWAKDRYKKAGFEGHFYQGQAFDLKMFPNQFFDSVVDGNCLHCILGNDRKKLYNDVKRVLKPEGIFYISTICGEPKPKWFQNDYDEYYDSDSKVVFRDSVPYRYFAEPDEIKEEINSAGFEIIESNLSANEHSDHLVLVCRILPETKSRINDM